MIYEKVQEVPGKLIIKEYPTKSASTQTLKNHIEKLKQRDIKPDMILVDYGDLLKPVTVTREKRHDLESIYEELRAIAQENKCPVWTASQTNRSGLNAEVVTLESISEAYSKCFVADFICSYPEQSTTKTIIQGACLLPKTVSVQTGLSTQLKWI